MVSSQILNSALYFQLTRWDGYANAISPILHRLFYNTLNKRENKKQDTLAEPTFTNTPTHHSRHFVET